MVWCWSALLLWMTTSSSVVGSFGVPPQVPTSHSPPSPLFVPRPFSGKTLGDHHEFHWSWRNRQDSNKRRRMPNWISCLSVQSPSSLEKEDHHDPDREDPFLEFHHHKNISSSSSFLRHVDQLLDQHLNQGFSNNNNKTHESSSRLSLLVQRIYQRTRQRHAADVDQAPSAFVRSSSLSTTTTTCQNNKMKHNGTPPESTTTTTWSPALSPQPPHQPFQAVLQSTRPLWNQSTIDLIRQAAEQHWAATTAPEDSSSTTTTTTSRFTYQRPGNSEAHVAELGPTVVSLVNELLLHHIYPAMFQHFSPLLRGSSVSYTPVHDKSDDNDELELFVYDALYIRYNATQATAAAAHPSQPDNDNNKGPGGRKGAGQPLHRDLSLVSANLMLNSDFDGGGTFFERQLRAVPQRGSNDDDDDKHNRSDTIRALQPAGVGHCLLHSSAERHAGANTLHGVRDVLVLFVSGISSSSTSTTRMPPAWIQAALLKHCQHECQPGSLLWKKNHTNDDTEQEDIPAPYLCSLLHNRLAVEAVPTDGEAFQYIGNALMTWANHVLSLNSNHDDPPATLPRDNDAPSVKWLLTLACRAYQEALHYTPCDGRIYNNLGLALTKLGTARQPQPPQQGWGHENNETVAADDQFRTQIEETYQTGLQLLEDSFEAGCDVDKDRTALRLNYGLWVANQDRFRKAVEILSPLVGVDSSTTTTNHNQQVLANAQKLHDFCLRQTKQTKKTS